MATLLPPCPLPPSFSQEFASEAAATSRGYLDLVSLRSLADIKGLVGVQTIDNMQPGELVWRGRCIYAACHAFAVHAFAHGT